MTYTTCARPLVHAWKERGLRPVATLAAELVTTGVPRPVADVITYIPPDGDRSRKRGYHPPQLLARELGRRWDLRCEPLLGRSRTVARQTGLAPVERRRNVQGAFVAVKPSPRTVVLVDDVYTTGATVSAAASALRASGARAVHVVTFARVVR